MNVSDLVHLIIWLTLAGLLFFVLWWGANQIAAEPFRTVARVAVVLVTVLVLVALILPMLGQPPVIRFR